MTITTYSTPTAWTSLFTNADLASRPNNTTVLSATIDNSVTKHLFMDVSVLLGSIAVSATGFLQVNLLPLLHDGTTFVDGNGTNAPTTSSVIATMALRNLTSAVASGAFTLQIPPVQFRLTLLLAPGVTTAATGNSSSYRLYSLNNA